MRKGPLRCRVHPTVQTKGDYLLSAHEEVVVTIVVPADRDEDSGGRVDEKERFRTKGLLNELY